jgi:chromosome segregation ATPase
VQGSPLSPTRPASIMRRRHSMQLMDLETKLDQVVSENRLLAEAKAKAEENLEDALYNQQRSTAALNEALETRDLELRNKDTEIGRLRETLERVQKEVARLTQVNESIVALNASLTAQNQALRAETASRDDASSVTTRQLEERTAQLENLRHQHDELTSGMEAIVRHEISVALEEKNTQLQRLNGELLSTREKVKALERQIMESKSSESFLVTRDEDYFETACQTLCQHVKEWVLRFSKFSDGKQCRLLDDIEEDKIRDRVDNTILDDTDVDYYLSDRVKRRDIFMSVVMIMVWEYIFTRYLFGMDREQRQKLKALEKTLADVGEFSTQFHFVSPSTIPS